MTGFELLQALPAAQTANLRRLAILRRVGGSAAHGSWEGLGSLEGVQDQAKFGLRDYRIGRCGGSRKTFPVDSSEPFSESDVKSFGQQSAKTGSSA